MARSGRHLAMTSTIENNEINNNEIGGDLIIGSVVVKLPNFNIDVSAAALKELISNHEKLREDSPEYEFFLEQLQEKIAAKVNRKVIGLENKLKLAKREHYYDGALISSQKAAKMIIKLQHVKSYQIIFNHVLSLILTRFKAHILPLLKKQCDEIIIASAINSTILEPLSQEVSMAGGNMSTELVEGMIYFLTEKCHVEWI